MIEETLLGLAAADLAPTLGCVTLAVAGLFVLVVLVVVVVLEVAVVLPRTLVVLAILGLAAVLRDTGLDVDTSRRDLFCWDWTPS